MPFVVGYARVSTAEQSLALQRDALAAAGCGRVVAEQASGAAERPHLAKLLSGLEAGDTLVVWKLDRLGRSVYGLVSLVKDLEARSIGFRSLTDSIDTSTPHGRLFFHIMAALAEMERELIRERTRAGLKAARARGRLGGRPRKLAPSKVEMARALLKDYPVKDVARMVGVSRSTLYAALRR